FIFFFFLFFFFFFFFCFFFFFFFFFFFSSRRRHTRWPRDWSSDVCSSDLYFSAERTKAVPRADISYPADWPERSARRLRYRDGEIYRGPAVRGDDGQDYYTAIYDLGDLVHPEIGRASCRESGGVGGAEVRS